MEELYRKIEKEGNFRFELVELVELVEFSGLEKKIDINEMDFYIDGIGLAWESQVGLKKHRDHFNAYATQEIAEKVAIIQRRTNALNWACAHVDPDCEPNWSTGTDKYFVAWDHKNEKFIPVCQCFIHRGQSPVSSKEKAEEAIALLYEVGADKLFAGDQ